MNHYRRHVAAAMIAAMPVMSAVATEMAAYPAKPVRVLVGIAPGGAVDVQARWFAQKLSAALDRQFVVDNRSGAGGLLAYQAATAAAPDGGLAIGSSPADFGRRMADEVARWQKLVKMSGLKFD